MTTVKYNASTTVRPRPPAPPAPRCRRKKTTSATNSGSALTRTRRGYQIRARTSAGEYSSAGNLSVSTASTPKKALKNQASSPSKPSSKAVTRDVMMLKIWTMPSGT